MAFPLTPIDGQQATVNNIIYVYSGSKSVWNKLATIGNTIVANSVVLTNPTPSTSTTTGVLRVAGGVGIQGNVYANVYYTVNGIFWAGNNAAYLIKPPVYTANTSPPISGNISGDQWYDTNTDILYEYLNDGTVSYWVDVQSLGQTGNITSMSDTTMSGNLVVGLNDIYSVGTSTGYLRRLFANAITANSITVNGSILPSANVVYDIGSNNLRFRDLYLSGSTIYFGGASISSDSSTVTITNPAGGTFLVSGSDSNRANLTIGNLAIEGNTATTSTTSGALKVTGGIATLGNLRVAGNVIAATNSGTQLGVGTAAPEAKVSIVSAAGGIGLTVKDANAGADNFFSIQYDGTTGLADVKAQSTGGSTQIALSTSLSGTTTERVRIDSNGNMGIGSTSPQQLVHLRKDQDGTTALLVQNRNSAGSPVSAIQFISGQFDLSDNRYAMISSDGGSSSTLKFSTSNGAAPVTQATITAAGLFQFNSGYGSVATAYGCRAWVNFDGTGTVGVNQTIRASGGVTSVSKSATGHYAVNLSVTLPDANYAVTTATNPNGYGGAYTGSGVATAPGTNTASIAYLETRDNTNVTSNSNTIMVAIFR